MTQHGRPAGAPGPGSRPGPAHPTGLAYQPGLDGVRALAVLAVLAYHDGRLHGGFLGVSTFFTLSGFLITGLLLAERRRTGRVALRDFYARRIRRLLPAAMLGLLLAALITPRLGDPSVDHAFRGDALSALFDVANWRFVAAGQSYGAQFALPSPVLHFWSLAVEEQFYIVLVPLIVGVFVLARARRRVLVAVLATLAVASAADGWLAVHRGALDRAYYGTDTRALEFLVGALLAVVLAGRPLGRRASRAAAAIGVAALAFLVMMTVRARATDAGLFRGGLLAYSLAGTVLLVAVCEPGPLRRLCSLGPLRALGRISYGVYVFHWPLFLWLDPSRTGLSGLSLTALRCGATFALATLSFVLVEQPVRTGHSVFGRRPWAVLTAGSLAVVVASATIGATAPALAVDFAPVQQPAAVLAAGRRPATIAPRRASPSGHAVAATRPLRRILVVGDSVALTLGRGIERWGARNGITVLNAAALGCTVLDDNELVRSYAGIGRRSPNSCHTLDAWPRIVSTFRPDLVVGLLGSWDVYDMSWDNGRTWSFAGEPAFDARWVTAMRGATQRLAATGARVLWVDPPCFGQHPGDNSTPSSPWYAPSRVAALGRLLHTVARETNESATDAVHAAGCPVDYAHRPDGVHFSDSGGDAMMPALAPAIRSAAAR